MTIPSVTSHDPGLFDQLDAVERAISREFSQRVHDFHMELVEEGLVLSGRTRRYFFKQEVQHAVIRAIDVPIVANAICVER